MPAAPLRLKEPLSRQQPLPDLACGPAITLYGGTVKGWREKADFTGRMRGLTFQLKTSHQENEDTRASTLCHIFLSLGSQNGDGVGVSVATAFMDYTFKSPWRQEITTAKIQITGEAQEQQWRLLACMKTHFELHQPSQHATC